MNNSAFWGGWVMFAALMMGLMGAYNALQGLAAVFADDYYVVNEDDLLILDFTVWGVVMVAWGIALLAGALALFRGRPWARWFALAVVGLNAVAQAGFLAAFPLWSMIVIGVSILVIFSLSVHWDDVQADLDSPA